MLFQFSKVIGIDLEIPEATCFLDMSHDWCLVKNGIPRALFLPVNVNVLFQQAIQFSDRLRISRTIHSLGRELLMHKIYQNWLRALLLEADDGPDARIFGDHVASMEIGHCKEESTIRITKTAEVMHSCS